MIDYGIWGLACPPRTGGQWVAAAAALCGFTPAPGGDLHTPPPVGYAGFVATTVRHPARLLASTYANGSPLRDAAHFEDRLASFLACYANQTPGQLWKNHLLFNASTVIKTEMLMHSVIDLFRTLGVGHAGIEQIRKLPHTNAGRAIPITIKQQQMIVRAESDYCEAYDYW